MSVADKVSIIAEALTLLDEPIWEEVVRREPEYQEMEPLARRYPAGAFLTLMVVAGLNDYQLKGKAEFAYWPPLRRHLERYPIPGSPRQMANILEPFYQKERYGSTKVKRLRRFLNSPIAQRLWESRPREIATNFVDIWKDIVRTMGQPPTAKTMAFAGKTLAIGLLLLGERDFDFRLPIPVDKRLLSLTPWLPDNEKVQTFWDKVLKRLRCHHPSLTHLHLDSLLWQYAGASDPHVYLSNLKIPPSAVSKIVNAFNALHDDP